MTDREARLRALVTKWRAAGDTEYTGWRSGANEKYRWRSSTLAQCADELDAALASEAIATPEPRPIVAITDRSGHVTAIPQGK
jgi:hypothetical protein